MAAAPNPMAAQSLALSSRKARRFKEFIVGG
jgi:hypothetical protein